MNSTLRQAASRSDGTGHPFSRAYRRYALGTLTFVYMLNLVDRGLMSLLLQPIKEDLNLSDSQLGFLTGIAFGLFYSTLGLPIARWADRGNRARITALSIGAWGATVMACVFVTSFVQLACARVLAAVGESGCKPPTYSLVGDYFPNPAERTRAMTIYMAGGLLSNVVSFMLGGWLAQRYGWRMAFFVMGLPGVLLALLVRFTIKEPRIRVAQPEAPQSLPPLRAVLIMLWRRRSLRHLSLALILLYTLALGLAPWYAAFLIRSHGMGTSELGVWLGLIFGLGGMAGVLLGGLVAARWFTGNERGQMKLNALTMIGLVPCFVAFLVLPGKHLALTMLVPLMMGLSFFMGPTYALLQRLVPSQMRATVLAVIMLLANLVGMGIGPQIVGILSDALRPALGAQSLRYAMLAMSLVAVGVAYQFWKVGQNIQDDLANVPR